MKRALLISGFLILFVAVFGVKKLYARGVRNNNPTNLRPGSGYTWLGQVGIDTSSGGPFVIFDTPQHGLRAGAITALHYFTRDGIKTLAEFGQRWAPVSDNNEKGYGEKLAAQLGVDANVTFNYIQKMPQLLNAIIHNEGNQALFLSNVDLQNASISAFSLG